LFSFQRTIHFAWRFSLPVCFSRPELEYTMHQYINATVFYKLIKKNDNLLQLPLTFVYDIYFTSDGTTLAQQP
jgi:hypothetical protein